MLGDKNHRGEAESAGRKDWNGARRWIPFTGNRCPGLLVFRQTAIPPGSTEIFQRIEKDRSMERICIRRVVSISWQENLEFDFNFDKPNAYPNLSSIE
ncbi:hypothetical protein HUU39_12630 [candidate division KSB1 bacterium]|nr:hypothetical protein [bacterium]NUM66107.1 hypothetical protein [candidate division KSB1 bacterium]